jgi:hypothetical protein
MRLDRYSTDLCRFMTKICIFLSFFVFASKFRQLLITIERLLSRTPPSLAEGVQSLRAADNSLPAFQRIFATYCQLMAKICIFLSFFVFASKVRLLLITIERLLSQTPPSLAGEAGRGFTNLFKRTLIQMSLYGHLKSVQPQNPRANKQTFSNFFSVFFASLW